MKSPMLYLLEVLFCSGMLLAFYRLLLVRKVSYALCRRYLVAAMVLSVVIPALDIPLYPARTVVYPLPLVGVTTPDPAFADADPAQGLALAAASEPITVAASAFSAVNWPRLLRYVVLVFCALTSAVLLGLLCARIVSIRRLRRRSRLSDCGEYTLAENPTVETPFSFLRTVFLGEGCEQPDRGMILCHEVSHIRHRHTAERLVFELLRALFWFNPFVWMASRWLSEVQEWEADRDVLDAGYDLTEYRSAIFCQLFGYNPDIACGLNHSLTKNRFAMMTQFRKRRFALLRLCAAVPVVAGMMLLCSFTTRDAEPPAAATPTPSAASADYMGLKPLPVHTWYTFAELKNGDVKNARFDHLKYLPVDNTKYRYVKGKGRRSYTITDLKGTDITDWAHKHYSKKAVNPLFIIDGVRFTASEFARREDKSSFPLETSRFYAGPEVGRVLGDATIDALIVIQTNGLAASFKDLHCPLRSTSPLGAYGKSARLSDYIHSGVDIAAKEGTPIVAAADGTITAAANDGGWGNRIRIAHADGCSSMYAHLKEMRVKQGDRVKGGDVIGTVGATGRTTGPHLHFEMAGSDEKTFDPALLFDFAAGTVRTPQPAAQPASQNVAMADSPAATPTAETASTPVASKNVARIHTGPGGKITLNGEPIMMEELSAKITAWREAMPAEERPNATVTITAEPGAKMGVVTDAKQELRKANALRVSYSTDGEPVQRFLPPAASTTLAVTPNSSAAAPKNPAPGTKIVEVTEIKIKQRDLMLVLISGSGRIMAGQPGKQDFAELGQLTELVKTFILNAGNSSSLPQLRAEEFTLPDGRKVTYPVSEGVVSLQTTRDTSYDTYVEVQRKLTAAFDSIRSDVAQKWFSRPYSTLSEAEREVIARAVPLKIFEAEPRSLPRHK